MINKKIILLIFILPLMFFLYFSYCSGITAPDTLEEAKEITKETIKDGELIGVMGKVWQENVVPTIQKVWQWIKNNIWSRIRGWLLPEFEKRKQYLEEGLEKEKEEIKEEVEKETPGIIKPFWERLEKLIK